MFVIMLLPQITSFNMMRDRVRMGIMENFILEFKRMVKHQLGGGLFYLYQALVTQSQNLL